MPAASRTGALVSAIFTSTTNNATLAGTTSAAVAAGGTAFFFIGVRGSTVVGAVTSISGLPGDAVTEILSVHQGTSSAGNNIVRVYCPTGMASGTTVTFTLDSAATRKLGWGDNWTNVGNANNVGTASASATSGTALSCGTTGATTTTTGVHFASHVLQSTATLTDVTPGSDEEGAMTEVADGEVGASNFCRLEVEYRLVTAAHAGGMTATATSGGTPAARSHQQVIWDGTAAATAPPPVQPQRRAMRALIVR